MPAPVQVSIRVLTYHAAVVVEEKMRVVCGRPRSLRLLLAIALLTGVCVLPECAARPVVGAASPPAVIVATPVSATAGSTITVSGAYFAVASSTFMPTVTVAFTDANGVKTTLGHTTSSSVGGAFSLAATIPVTAATGPGLIGAVDISGTAATLPFDVRPQSTRVSVTPSSSAPFSTVAVTGTGFAVNQPITLSFIQGVSATVLSGGAAVTTNAGNFSSTVTVPARAAGGTATIMAQDRDSNSASASLTILRSGPPTVTVSPVPAVPGGSITVNGQNFVANQPITLTIVQSSTVLATITNAGTTAASGAFTISVTLPQGTQPGTVALTAADGVGDSATTNVSVAIPYNANNGPSSFYFAEGYTGQISTNKRATFAETLAILNPNPFAATTVITYLIEGGSPIVVTRSISANATLRESVNDDIGPDKSVAAVVTSASRIYVERVIRRVGANHATLDASSSLGSSSPGRTFYFAEGYTGITFQEYLVVANPGSTDAHVTVTYAPQANSSAGAPVQTFVLPANGRVTRNVRRDVGHIANKSVGMIVSSDQPIMAERVLYFGSGDGSGKFGATTKPGIQTPATQYFFAFGSAGGKGLAQQPGDQSFVTILNPDLAKQPASVTAQFYDAQGRGMGSTTVSVAPGTRRTINANTIVGQTSSVYATVLTSALPFVAERPQYFGGSPNEGEHAGIAPTGTPAGTRTVAFPDLSLTSILGEPIQRTVFLYNPTQAPISVSGTFYSAGGSRTVTYAVQANSIAAVNVNADATGLSSTALGGVFTVAGSGSFAATSIGNTLDNRSYTGSEGITGQ